MRTTEELEKLVGQRFNKLLVLKHLGTRPTSKSIHRKTGKEKIMTTRYYLCRCECGREKELTLSNLKKQIGCRHCALYKVNALHRKPMYNRWYSMINRCNIKLKRSHKNQTKFGVKVCKRWLSSFDAYAKDAGKPPTPKHVFGRIDKKKDFSPANCKWMTHTEKALSNPHNKELTIMNLSKEVLQSVEGITQVTNHALKNKKNELNKYIERIDYLPKSKRVIYKQGAIEFFNQKKYRSHQ